MLPSTACMRAVTMSTLMCSHCESLILAWKYCCEGVEGFAAWTTTMTVL